MSELANQRFDDTVDEVLSGHKYDVLMERVPDLRERLNEILQKIYDRISGDGLGLDGAIPRFAGDASLTRNIFMAVGILLLGFAAFHIAKRIGGRRRIEQTMEELWGDLSGGVLTCDELLARAAICAASGEYRDAVRYEYISLLWVLGQTALLSNSDYKTGSQIEREISVSAPALHKPFCNVLDTFNRIWFGHKKIDKDEYGENSRLIHNLLAEAKNHAKTA
ncbi:hypothetical protein AGMMS49975_03700 [Clostridia bacterium]|nr:hypothetical protein AGMMS49975_03700 [Clostridia bacterium]